MGQVSDRAQSEMDDVSLSHINGDLLAFTLIDSLGEGNVEDTEDVSGGHASCWHTSTRGRWPLLDTQELVIPDDVAQDLESVLEDPLHELFVLIVDGIVDEREEGDESLG